ncbi:hypothetical protein [Streptomyces sp. MN13]
MFTRIRYGPNSRASEYIALVRVGRVELVVPFVPNVPGTDTYVGELR